jgi:hypothetical protein
MTRLAVNSPTIGTIGLVAMLPSVPGTGVLDKPLLRPLFGRHQLVGSSSVRGHVTDLLAEEGGVIVGDEVLGLHRRHRRERPAVAQDGKHPHPTGWTTLESVPSWDDRVTGRLTSYRTCPGPVEVERGGAGVTVSWVLATSLADVLSSSGNDRTLGPAPRIPL